MMMNLTWKVRLLLNMLAVLSSMILLTGCNPKELPIIKPALDKYDNYVSEQVKQLISEDPELKELDSWCTQIPLPEGARLVSVGLYKGPMIGYSYEFDKSLGLSESIFRDYFVQAAWTEERSTYLGEIIFKNDGRRVSIWLAEARSTGKFGINCEDSLRRGRKVDPQR